MTTIHEGCWEIPRYGRKNERVGREELADLTPLCSHCHAMVHVLERRGLIGLDFSGFVDKVRADRYREQQRDTGASEWEQAQLARQTELGFLRVKAKIRDAMRTLPPSEGAALLNRLGSILSSA